METKYWVVGGVVLGVAGVIYYINKSGANMTAQGMPVAPGAMTYAQYTAQQAAMAQAQAQAQQQPGVMPPTMATPMNATPGNLPQSFRSPGLTPPTSAPGMPSVQPMTQMLAPPPNLAATRLQLRTPPLMPQPVPPRPAGPGFPGFPGGFPGFPTASAGNHLRWGNENLPWRMPSARMPGPNLTRHLRWG